MAKSVIVARAAEVVNSPPEAQVKRSAHIVLHMIAEGRYAEAASFLFGMHKMHISEWVAVKRELLGAAGDMKTLQTIAMLFEASKRSTLQESAPFIPGLGSLIQTDFSSELVG